MSLINGNISGYQGGGAGIFANELVVVPTGLPPTGAAGGALTGTYPNPSLAADSVTSANIVAGTITAADIAAGVLTLPSTQIGGSTGGNIAGSGVTILTNGASISQVGNFNINYLGVLLPQPPGSFVSEVFEIGIASEFTVTGAIVGTVDMTIDIPNCPDLVAAGVSGQIAFVTGTTSNPSVSWMELLSPPLASQITLRFHIPNVAQTYRSQVMRIYAGL